MRRILMVVAMVAMAFSMSAGVANASAQHIVTQVSTHGPGGESSHFSGWEYPIGSISSKFEATKDSRSLGMRAFTKCAQGPGLHDFTAVSGWIRHTGESTQPASCPAHDIRVDQAGYQYYYWKFVIGTENNGSWVRKIGTHPLYTRGRNSAQPATLTSFTRACSQSVYPPGKPGHLGLVFSVKLRTDTCGRWVKAAERCKYPGAFSGFTYKWHYGLKPVRILGSKSETECGVLAVKATNWGFAFYDHGTKKWVYKQEGHS